LSQGDENESFWKELGGKPANYQFVAHVPDDFTAPKSILYKVDLGKEFIELPQGNCFAIENEIFYCFVMFNS